MKRIGLERIFWAAFPREPAPNASSGISTIIAPAICNELLTAMKYVYSFCYGIFMIIKMLEGLVSLTLIYPYNIKSLLTLCYPCMGQHVLEITTVFSTSFSLFLGLGRLKGVSTYKYLVNS